MVLASSALFVTAACGAAEPTTYSVAELYPRCAALIGKTVRVTGYLGICAGYDCILSPSKAEWNSSLKALDGSSPNNAGNQPIAMSIGYTEAFDRKAEPLQHHYVIITGRIVGSCLPGGTDRASGIEPIDVSPWTPARDGRSNTQ